MRSAVVLLFVVLAIVGIVSGDSLCNEDFFFVADIVLKTCPTLEADQQNKEAEDRVRRLLQGGIAYEKRTPNKLDEEYASYFTAAKRPSFAGGGFGKRPSFAGGYGKRPEEQQNGALEKRPSFGGGGYGKRNEETSVEDGNRLEEMLQRLRQSEPSQQFYAMARRRRRDVTKLKRGNWKDYASLGKRFYYLAQKEEELIKENVRQLNQRCCTTGCTYQDMQQALCDHVYY